MEEAAEADRVIVMKDGEIALEGTPSEIFSRAKLIQELGLEVPKLAQLNLRLRECGVGLPDILSEDELVMELCRLKSQT